MAHESDQQDYLIEHIDENMVSCSDGTSFFRRANVLQPSFPCSRKGKNLLTSPPRIPVHEKPISPIIKTLASKVRFNGWKNPLKRWNTWVDNMRDKHEAIWKKACIFEAIMASKVIIPKCYESLFGLAEKWCPETNTFLLPWGEITVTLEDVLVLGGFSVIGDSVTAELQSAKLIEILDSLHVSRKKLNKSKHKKASQKQWMEMYMDKGSEIEHEAFLCLWLSRYVLATADDGTINRRVVPLAVHLATGNRLALAPAVLAGIYSDLKLLKEKIETLRGISDEDCNNVTKVKLLAPFQLFQAWIWERFPSLSPDPKPIIDGFRMERWNKVKLSKDEEWEVDFVGNDFRWRPYTTPLNNWTCSPKFYPNKAVWMSTVWYGDSYDIQSYARCVRNSELVGVKSDCAQQYLPHRVAMQFGLDQDIPSALPHFSSGEKPEWNKYNRRIEDAILYVPPKHLESEVTIHYFEWWKKAAVKKEPADGSSHSSPQVDGMQADDDSGDDHLTLTQLFRSNSFAGATGGSSRPHNHFDTTPSSSGDTESLQVVRHNAAGTMAIGCTRNGLTMEDGTRGGTGSPVHSPPNTNKMGEEASSSGTHQLSEIDLPDRISRLRRVIDIVKAAKLG